MLCAKSEAEKAEVRIKLEAVGKALAVDCSEKVRAAYAVAHRGESRLGLQGSIQLPSASAAVGAVPLINENS